MKKTILLFLVLQILFFVSIAGAVNYGYDYLEEEGALLVDGAPPIVVSGNLTNFTSLEDTPATYAGDGGDCVAVNSIETALEFVACVIGNIFDQNLNTTSNVTFDGVNVTRILEVNGTVDIVHLATTADDHALDINIDADGIGDIRAVEIDYKTGDIELGQDEAVILVNIDQSLATGGDVFAFEVLATEGSARPTGLKVGALVDPIHHDSGVFANAGICDINGVNQSVACDSSGTDVAIFENDNDYVILGDINKFEEIEFLLNTEASNPGIAPKFEFSTGAGTWDTFTPIDGTNQMRQSGVIAYESSDIPTWAVSGSEFLINITRTRNNMGTTPIEDKIQIAAIKEFIWDKDGVVNVDTLKALNWSNVSLDVSQVEGINIFDQELNTTSNVTFDTINTSGDITIGDGAFSTTYSLLFFGDLNIGILRWDDINDRFEFVDDLNMINNMIRFGNDDTFVQGGDTAQRDLFLSAAQDIHLNAADVTVEQKISHDGDADTFIEITPNDISITAGSHLYVSQSSPAFTPIFQVNPDGVDADYQVFGLNDDNLIFADGSLDRACVGCLTPSTKLEVDGNLTIGSKLIFRFGEIIDNIVDGWITITGSQNITENLNVHGNITVNNLMNLERTDQTLDVGNISATSSYIRLDTEGGAATDDLYNIFGGAVGSIMILQTTNNGRDITLVDSESGGNLDLSNNFTLSNNRRRVTLLFDGTSWFELSSSNN